MRKKGVVSGQNWVFDGKAITVRIPMTWKRRGGRKAIIAPDGGDAWAPAKRRPDETLIRALARAHRWKRMLEEGNHDAINALAKAENINRAYVCRLLNLTLLAPDIVEAILDGRQQKYDIGQPDWINSWNLARTIGVNARLVIGILKLVFQALSVILQPGFARLEVRDLGFYMLPEARGVIVFQ